MSESERGGKRNLLTLNILKSFTDSKQFGESSRNTVKKPLFVCFVTFVTVVVVVVVVTFFRLNRFEMNECKQVGGSESENERQTQIHTFQGHSHQFIVSSFSSKSLRVRHAISLENLQKRKPKE